MIDNELIIEVRQKADIVDIISEYINLVPKGKNYFGVCPFHNDENPSMSVSKDKQIYTCFSCGANGNVFSFVKDYENVSFPEAVKIVASKVGMDLNIKSSNQNDKFSNEHTIMDLSSKFYINSLNTKDGLSAKEYLKTRGIDDETISDFKIGYSPNDKDSLYNFFTTQNYTLEQLESLGLVSKNGLDIFDFFRNRIIIPITNSNGKVVGFTGRIFSGEDNAKYINSKETLIFKKSNILFNYHNAKNNIKNKKEVILVEGNMDAIKLSSKGIKNVLALMGTALTNNHIEQLKRLNSDIILIFDSDNAGINATIANGDLLLKSKVPTYVVLLDDSAKDPDEYIEKFGVDKFHNLLKSKLSYVDFKINELKKTKNLNNSDDLVKFIKEVIETLKYIDDFKKNVILTKLCSDYNLDINLFKNELTQTNSVTIKKTLINEETKQERKISKYRYLANVILYYISSDYKYFQIYKDDLNFFKDKEERDLASEIDIFYKENEKVGFADFITYISKDENLYQRIKEISSSLSEYELTHQNFLEYLSLMQKRLILEEIDELKIKIKNEINEDKKIKYIEKLTKLKRGSVENERN